ncbi:hypothetical protein [Methylosinus sp. LW3]|uniref:hypothetical protein n=1 Tax=Methylosinus sp. LW3 TaxID=107635 RepID=UPI0012F8E0F9|nr:hypothetical protein [Methylosinus sp. LW3]
MTTELKAEDALAELKAKRRALSAESAELHQALRPAGEDGLTKKARIERELAALAEAEAAAVQEWVRGERSAPPPQPDRDRRKALRAELADVGDLIEEQRAASAALAAAAEEYSRIYGGLSHEIDRVALDILAGRAEADFAAAIAAHDAAVAAMARLDAWRDALGQLRDQFVSQRKPALAQRANVIIDAVQVRRDIPHDDRQRHALRTELETTVAQLRA